MAADTPFDDIAAELYVVRPDEFVVARNARAARIEDAQLASEVKRLRKPLLAAWVVNLFAHEKADELGEVLELAEALREAQEDLDAASLTQLGRQRRALVRSLAKKAADLASERGERMTPSTVEAVEQTLNAAMFDQAAAAAVASRRLMRPLEASEEVDLSEAVAGSLDAPAPARRSAAPDEVGARRARKEAERAVKAAEDELARAERAQADAGRRMRAAEERLTALTEQAERLRTELARVQADAEQAEQDAKQLAEERGKAAMRVEHAHEAADAARAKLP